MDFKVNVASGNALLEARDLRVSGTGLDFGLKRHWNSLDLASAEMGPGWTVSPSHQVELVFIQTGAVSVRGPSAWRALFKPDGSGDFNSPPSVDATMIEKDSGGYRLRWHSKEDWHFNAQGVLLRQEDRNDNSITYARDGQGRTATATDTQGRKVNYHYSGGRLTRVEDVSGNRSWRYEYEHGRLVRSIDPVNGDSAPTRYEWDSNSRLIRVIDPRGNSTKIGYDAGDRVTSITRVDDPANDTGPTWTFGYDASFPKCQDEDPDLVTTVVTDPLEHKTRYCHGGHGRVEAVFDAKGNKVTTSYDSLGNVQDLTDAGVANPFKFTFSANDDTLTDVELPTGGTSHMAYNDGTNPHFPTQVWDFQNTGDRNDPSTASYIYDYDQDGNLKSVEAPPIEEVPDEPWFEFFYNHPKKVLTKIEDEQDRATILSYDAQGNLIGWDPPGPHGTVTLTYDAVSRVETMTDGRGETATYTYDDLDRIDRIDYTDGSYVDYDYDANGNLVFREETRPEPPGQELLYETTSSTFTYDELNRMETQTHPQPQEVVEYTYDDAGNLKTIEDSTGVTSYTYDEVNLVDIVTDPDGRETDIDHDGRRLRTQVLFPNGEKVTTGWDDSRRLDLLEAFSQGGAKKLSRDYDYSEATTDTSLVQKITELNGDLTAYKYDPINRLKRALTEDSGGATQEDLDFDYDPNGNLTHTSDGSTDTWFSYGAGNQLECRWEGAESPSCPSGSSTTYGYDAAGNLVSDSDGLAIDYNAKGQTISVTPPGGTPTEMDYLDATQDRRIEKGGTSYLHTQLGLTAQQSTPLTRTTFVRDPNGGLLYERGTGQRYYALDHLQSVVGAFDGGGAFTEADYDPYGGGAPPSGAAFGFASGYLDDYASLDLYKFGTRYYEPAETMRWTQHDPDRGTISQPLTLNPYLYVGSNPVNFADPSGRGIFDVAQTLAAAVVGCVQWGATLGLLGLIIGARFGLPQLGIVGLVAGCGLGIADAIFDWGLPGPQG